MNVHQFPLNSIYLQCVVDPYNWCLIAVPRSEIELETYRSIGYRIRPRLVRMMG
jgi:hypothetical protein